MYYNLAKVRRGANIRSLKLPQSTLLTHARCALQDGYDNKLGPNNPKALKVEYGLICCSCESKYVMAEKLEGLVHKLEEVLGPNHEVTLDALNSYGACLDRNGKYESSRQILEKVRSRSERRDELGMR